MRARAKLLFVMKWFGLTSCVLIFAAFISSIWFTVGRVHGWATTGIEHGMLVVLIARPELYPALEEAEPFWFGSRQRGRPARNLVWPAEFQSQNALANVYTVPLWLPFAAVLLPTLLIWFLDRRCRPHPFGHCPGCGYNLTGNTTGRCPECGQTSSAADAPGFGV